MPIYLDNSSTTFPKPPAVVEAIAVAFLIVLVILAALALAGRFSALAASRMRELGLLRTFGMSRGRVVGCFACEIGLVTLVAAVVAVAVACQRSSSKYSLMPD